jgi:hypothetical protein
MKQLGDWAGAEVAMAVICCSARFAGGGGMPKFVIERNIPGAGELTVEQLQAIAQKSCSAIRKIGPHLQWVQSFVTDDKIYCIYISPDEATIREHAKLGGFPADSVKVVRMVIDPTTQE